MKKFFNFVCKTSSGMASGLFATLIIGTILQQLLNLVGLEKLGTEIFLIFKSLMAPGIAIGVALAIRKDYSILQTVSIAALGGIIGCINLKAPNSPIPTIVANGGSQNPLLIYLAVIFATLTVDKLLRKKTPIDIILIPITYIIVGIIYGLILIYPSYYLVYGIQSLIEYAMPQIPLIMAIIISVIVGMVLTLPISSAAICIMIDIGSVPLAAGAAVIGCSVQMIGFAVQSFRSKNGVGKTLSVGVGTSMLYWPNIVAKPAIWLPTIISSAILGPIGVCLLKTSATSAGAGMGTSGLVGLLSTLSSMNYSINAYISVFAIQIIGSIILTYLFDYLFCDVLKLYTKEDLKLDI